MVSQGDGGAIGWDDIDFIKNSFAVVAHAGDGEGVVLWEIGPHMDIEVGLHGRYLDDLRLVGAPRGISIWEGRYVGGQPMGYFRCPMATEAARILRGENPFERLRGYYGPEAD